MGQVRITYYGHACFMLEYNGYRVVLDPYANGSVPGLGDLQMEAEAVYCSHGHGDHNYAEAVALQKTDASAPYTLEELTVPHDDVGGAKRGMNTVRIFRFGDLRVAHMGDIGRVLTQEEIERLFKVDCVLLPVGGFFTVDAAQAKTIVEQIKPKVTVPMHYRMEGMGYPVIGTLQDFLEQFSDVHYGDSSLTLTADRAEGIYVLTPKMKIGE